MSANVVHAKLAFEVNVSDFLATPSFYRNEIIPKLFLIIIKGYKGPIYYVIEKQYSLLNS